MARIAGVNIPKEKRLDIALTYIYGIGPTTANKICKKVGVDLKTRTHQVSEEVLAKLRSYIVFELIFVSI